MTINSTNPQIKIKTFLLFPGELIAKLVRHGSFLKPVTSLSLAPAGHTLLRSRPELRSGITSSGISSPSGGFCSAQPCFHPLEARRSNARPPASLVSFFTTGSYSLHSLPWMLDRLKLQSLSVLLRKISFLFLILLPFISSQITLRINVCSPPPLYQYSEKENKIPSGGLNLFPLIPSQKKRETNALIYSCPRQNRKIHLQIPAKAIYTYILMPFLINNSQVKQHGFWLVFIKKVYPFNNDKKSAQFIEKLYCTGLWTRLGITHHLQHYFSDTGNSRFPVWEKLEQCNPLMIPYTHSQVIKQKVIPPVWKYLRFP